MPDIRNVATRESYGAELVRLGALRDDIVVLDADLATATKTALFKKAYPTRFFDCGIQECNMMGVAAGLAAAGMLPFASTFAMFAAGRAFEIIRNSIGYTGLNVKIGASHAGISVGEDGASHQCNEDIALMRTIPGMTVMQPCDDIEARAMVRAAAEYVGPVYMRFSRMVSPVINGETYNFEWGRGVLMRDGTDITIIASGRLVASSLEAAERLASEGVSARVINIHTIKPIDEDIILAAAKETGRVVVAEEHSVIGGLGSAVCEVLSRRMPVPTRLVGVNDVFGYSGPAAELLKLFGLDAGGVYKAAREILA